MVRAAALVIVALLSSAAEAQQSLRDKTFEHRARIQTIASNQTLRDTKMEIAATGTNSRWFIRAGDLADIWTSNTFYPHAWVFVDRSHDKTAKARESRMRVAVRCKEQQFAVLVMVDYAASGQVLRTTTLMDIPSSYDGIIPETMGESVAQELCPVD